MKNLIILFLAISSLSCVKKVEKIKTPTFVFNYQDAKSNYTLRYIGKDSLYLNDLKTNKNYGTSINSVLGNEVSRTINKIDKPEYADAYQSKPGSDITFKILILNARLSPEPAAKNKNAEKDVYEAAKKLNALKNELNFVPSKK
ncbi:hypothetical protein HNP37_000814 [Flavobacterium nitrogenifigens]|jgi:hypothetical protein|uniref:Lipoprotein n=2 Tax=Flavobacterium TaxID=237 RepID=A0A7W7IVU3_9FLAO|nr:MULTISPECIES: hypothetical protein [Flavobacterium]MBB4800775.1 hypothetical protein [Flavobacterium nitrogenifigens]MBB6385477.1 hypothetical protein [Flavobacterium notoginsengisoli]